MPLLIQKYKPGDRIVIACPDPLHGLVGFRPHILGVKGVIEAKAICEWPNAWLVRFLHPVSHNVITAIFPQTMFIKG